MGDRYKVGDRLYSVFVCGADVDEEEGPYPAEVSLSMYIIRTIRRRPRGRLFRLPPPTYPATVTAYPSEWVRTTIKGLVFDKYCPRWAMKQWPVTEEPFGLSRSKVGAYRKALADLRGHQTGTHFRLEDEEFNMLVGRLKAGITRNKRKKVSP